jgi:hypothetical protein
VECVTSFNFYTKFLVTTMLPLALMALSLLIWGVFVVFNLRDMVINRFLTSFGADFLSGCRTTTTRVVCGGVSAVACIVPIAQFLSFAAGQLRVFIKARFFVHLCSFLLTFFDQLGHALHVLPALPLGVEQSAQVRCMDLELVLIRLCLQRLRLQGGGRAAIPGRRLQH